MLIVGHFSVIHLAKNQVGTVWPNWEPLHSPSLALNFMSALDSQACGFLVPGLSHLFYSCLLVTGLGLPVWNIPYHHNHPSCLVFSWPHLLRGTPFPNSRSGQVLFICSRASDFQPESCAGHQFWVNVGDWREIQFGTILQV